MLGLVAGVDVESEVEEAEGGVDVVERPDRRVVAGFDEEDDAEGFSGVDAGRDDD